MMVDCSSLVNQVSGLWFSFGHSTYQSETDPISLSAIHCWPSVDQLCVGPAWLESCVVESHSAGTVATFYLDA